MHALDFRQFHVGEEVSLLKSDNVTAVKKKGNRSLTYNYSVYIGVNREQLNYSLVVG
jgi:hypothetical protein